MKVVYVLYLILVHDYLTEDMTLHRIDFPDKEDIFNKIQDFMFSFQIRDKVDIQKFLTQANETSLALFKKSDDFINEYVETSEMSKKDKLKDIELMIEAFVEEERYEDCAFLVKIKDKILKFYEKSSRIIRSF